jgi:hypothetical protein
MMKNCSGNAPNEQPCKAAPAMRANDNQIGVPVHGRFDEPMRRAAISHLALGLEARRP